MFDIISVGGATTDVFVRVKGEIEKIHGHLDVCLSVGSKLLIEELKFDTGGAGTNTAVSFSRLGLKTGWIGVLGSDHNSAMIADCMKKEKVSFLGEQKSGNVGYSVILTGLKKDRTILYYRGINDQLLKFKNSKTKWYYFGSLLGKSFETGKKLAVFAKKNKIPFAFNPSTYLAKKGISYLRPFLDGCSVLVLNLEEAKLLLKNISSTTEMLKKLNNYSKIVVITDGSKGVIAFDGKHKYTVFPGKVPVVETTGAGDAFASGFVSGLIMKYPIEKALQLAVANSESVIQHIGAKNNLLFRKDLRKIKARRVEKCLLA